jgi:hypothetical protein
VLITERDTIVDVVADRRNEGPPLENLPKKGPRRIRKAVGLAVAAAEQTVRTSTGSSSSGCCTTYGAVVSGSPMSCTRKSVDMPTWPAGARISRPTGSSKTTRLVPACHSRFKTFGTAQFAPLVTGFLRTTSALLIFMHGSNAYECGQPRYFL